MMKELGIQGRIKRKYIATTNSKHNNRIYSNLIKDKELTGINQVWFADITYINQDTQRFCLPRRHPGYLFPKNSRYAIGKTLFPKLAITTLNMTIAARKTDNLIHHSDQRSKFL